MDGVGLLKTEWKWRSRKKTRLEERDGESEKGNRCEEKRNVKEMRRGEDTIGR